MDNGRRFELYDYYQKTVFRIKVFDYLSTVIWDNRQMRELEIPNLLWCKQKEIVDDGTRSYYKGKTILITGGGSSIDSELCCLLAKIELK